MGQIASVVLPAFLASLVEFAEALTIVLAVSATRGARPAVAGTIAGVAALAAIVAAFGPALGRIPLATLQLVVGIMLLFFGMRWLRKAILRYAGVVALHDEAKIFEREKAVLAHVSLARASLDWPAIATSFNAVLLEGLEVVFIVIAVGATARAIVPAAIGAAAAGLVVVGAGCALRRPLARVPENTLKFLVGVMLSSFGTFWTAEGMRLAWPRGDAALPCLALGFLAASGLALLVSHGARRSTVTNSA